MEGYERKEVLELYLYLNMNAYLGEQGKEPIFST